MSTTTTTTTATGTGATTGTGAAVLPQRTQPFVTDAGLETELIFSDGRELPLFASFPLLETAEGRARLRRYYEGFVDIARRHGVGLLLETPTWRANADWAEQLGFDAPALAALNADAVTFLRELAAEASDLPAVVVSGQIGPRGDGYAPASLMSADEAAAYHDAQVAAFAAAGADLATAYTIGYVAEAIGLVRAAAHHRLPIAISFTVETDGCLPSGEALGAAIEAVDAATGAGAAYYLVNCAHPDHFAAVLDRDADWTGRIGGIRVNASTKSHAELDESTELDDGDPVDLAARCVALRASLPGATIVGGCCGTDARHVAAMWEAWTAGRSITM